MTKDTYRTGLRIKKTWNEGGKTRLTGASTADDSQRLTSLQREIDASKSWLSSTVVDKRGVLKCYSSAGKIGLCEVDLSVSLIGERWLGV